MPIGDRLARDSAASYEIHVQGNLSSAWSDRMGGVAIRAGNLPDGTPQTILMGEFQDQAALAGVLSTLYDLGLPLISVACLDVDQQLPGAPLSDAPPMLANDRAPQGGC